MSLVNRFTPGRRCCGVCIDRGCDCNNAALQVCLTLSGITVFCFEGELDCDEGRAFMEGSGPLGPFNPNSSFPLTVPVAPRPTTLCYELKAPHVTCGPNAGYLLTRIQVAFADGTALPFFRDLTIYLYVTKPVAGQAEVNAVIWISDDPFGDRCDPVLHLRYTLTSVPVDCSNFGPVPMEVVSSRGPISFDVSWLDFTYAMATIAFSPDCYYTIPGSGCCETIQPPATLHLTQQFDLADCPVVDLPITRSGAWPANSYTGSSGGCNYELSCQVAGSVYTPALTWGALPQTRTITMLSCSPFHAEDAGGLIQIVP